MEKICNRTYQDSVAREVLVRNILNPKPQTRSVGKLAAGLTSAVLLASLGTPAGRNAVATVGNETYQTALNLKTAASYGDAGNILYTKDFAKFPYETTPKDIARDIVGDGEIANQINLASLVADYIAKANNLTGTDSMIEANKIIIVPKYDLKHGRRLGDLVDTVSK